MIEVPEPSGEGSFEAAFFVWESLSSSFNQGSTRRRVKTGYLLGFLFLLRIYLRPHYSSGSGITEKFKQSLYKQVFGGITMTFLIFSALCSVGDYWGADFHIYGLSKLIISFLTFQTFICSFTVRTAIGKIRGAFFLFVVLVSLVMFFGIPGDSVVKNPPADAEDVDLIPGLARFPGEGNGHPLQYSCMENPMDRRAWQATVHGVAKGLDMT